MPLLVLPLASPLTYLAQLFTSTSCLLTCEVIHLLCLVSLPFTNRILAPWKQESLMYLKHLEHCAAHSGYFVCVCWKNAWTKPTHKEADSLMNMKWPGMIGFSRDWGCRRYFFPNRRDVAAGKHWPLQRLSWKWTKKYGKESSDDSPAKLFPCYISGGLTWAWEHSVFGVRTCPCF